MINQLEICVETCKDCYLHAWCSRHDQSKYDSYFQGFRHKVLQKFPHARILKNIPKPSYQKLSAASSLGEGKYFDTRQQRIVSYPRFGSFEVTVNGVLIFSKIACSMWPNIECLCRLVSKTLDSLNKGISPNLLSLGYGLTNDGSSCQASTKSGVGKRPRLEKCNSSLNVRNGKSRGTNDCCVLKLASKDKSSKVNLKSKTLNLKTVKNINTCYGLKQMSAGRSIKKVLPNSITKIKPKTMILAHPGKTVFTKSPLIGPKTQTYFGPKKILKVKTQENQEQPKTINIEEKAKENKGKTFLKQENSKNGSLNGRPSIKSASLFGHSCFEVQQLNNETNRQVQYPSFDIMVTEEKNVNENAVQNDGKNTNFSEQVSQQSNLAMEMVQLKQDTKIIRSTSLYERLNKQQETSIMIDDQQEDSPRKRENNQQKPQASIPFSYLMPTKMHDWSASVSMEISQLQRKIGKSAAMQSNEPANILNKLEYASSCLKVEKSDVKRMIVQNDQRDIGTQEIKTSDGLFCQENCPKTNHAFFKQIEHVFKDNLPVLGISKSYDSNIIEPQIQHRDIKMQSPKFHFSKNTFLSDVYSEPFESSIIKCEESHSHLFAGENMKQMQSQILGKPEVQF